MTGVSKPSASTSSNVDSDVDVDRRAMRQFNEKWRLGRNWLVYSKTSNTMHCEDCRKYGNEKVKALSFVAGTSNFKVEAIKDHETSNAHLSTLKVKRAKTDGSKDSVAMKSLAVMKTAELERMELLFRNVHGIGKKSRPFTDYVWQCE